MCNFSCNFKFFYTNFDKKNENTNPKDKSIYTCQNG